MAPTTGYKLNSDGCSRGNPGVSGGGVVVRDREGKLIFGYSCSLVACYVYQKLDICDVVTTYFYGTFDNDIYGTLDS